MAYLGSAAYQLDNSQRTWEVPVSRDLTVHEGGRLDARAREGASSAFVSVVRSLAVLAVAFALLGVARVGLISATVSCLRDISSAESTVAQARVTRTELQVERSALSSVDRIQRIATQNYGMVYASDVDTITLSQADDEAASADDAQIGEDVATDDSVA